MKSPFRRRAAVAALLLVPVLSACGFNVQTDQVYQPGEGVNDRSGQVDVLNALVVSGTDGAGTFAGTLVNNSQSDDDELTSVTGEGVQVAMDDAVQIPAAGLVNLADEGKISVLGEAVRAGSFVTLTFVFAGGQSTTVKMPVVVHADDYADVPLPRARLTADDSATTPSDAESSAAE